MQGIRKHTFKTLQVLVSIFQQTGFPQASCRQVLKTSFGITLHSMRDHQSAAALVHISAESDTGNQAHGKFSVHWALVAFMLLFGSGIVILHSIISKHCRLALQYCLVACYLIQEGRRCLKKSDCCASLFLWPGKKLHWNFSGLSWINSGASTFCLSLTSPPRILFCSISLFHFHPREWEDQMHSHHQVRGAAFGVLPQAPRGLGLALINAYWKLACQEKGFSQSFSLTLFVICKIENIYVPLFNKSSSESGLQNKINQ